MRTPEITFRRAFCALIFLAVISLPAARAAGIIMAQADEPALSEISGQLADGKVVTGCRDIGGTKYVVGSVLVDDTPQAVWKTLVNPFEFERKISPRLKSVTVIADQPESSTLSCTVGLMFPLPDLNYVVESHYTACKRVDFQRVSGSFRDFRGFWLLTPVDDGKRTIVTYSMYIDLGLPLPDWLVRQGLKMEFPGMLSGLRDRVAALKENPAPVQKRNLVAASVLGGKVAAAPAMSRLLP